MKLTSSDHPMSSDHVGRAFSLPGIPQRIVSLCPSQTELLFDLGLGEQVVGRTRFCIHPHPEIKAVSQVGGTKEIRLDRIRALKPDLILCEKEENTQKIVEALEAEFPVFVTDVTDYVSSLRMIRDIGRLCGKEQEALEMTQEIQTLFSKIQPLKDQSIAYFIWKDPWMVVGQNTFIDSMLSLCGFTNVFRNHSGRYPSITTQELATSNPDHIFLSSEPYPFKEAHLQELAQWIPDAKIRLVDGEMFTWYGSRMLKAAGYLHSLLRSLS